MAERFDQSHEAAWQGRQNFRTAWSTRVGRMRDEILRFQQAPLHLRLRWAALPAVALLAGLHQLVILTLSKPLAPGWQWGLGALVYSLTGGVVTWLGITWISQAVARSAQAEAHLRAAYAALEGNHQKLLTLNDLGQQLANANDVHAVLQLAAQAPLQLTNARASTVVTFNEDQNRLNLDMAWGLSEEYLRALRSRIERGIPAERCRTCGVLHAEISQDCPLFDELQPFAKREGLDTLLCLPIVNDQERVGIISAYFPSADGPPEDQVRLLSILSGAIGVMFDSLRSRERQVSTLYELDQASQAADILGDFSDQVLQIVTAGWDAQAGGLFLWDAKTQLWSCRASRGLGDSPDEARYQYALSLVRRAAQTGQPVFEADLDTSQPLSLGSAAAAPLAAEGQVLGAIFLGARRRRAITERHVDLLRTMAHQTALALRNAQLYDQLGRMAVLEERYRLSRELHDGLAQTLAFLGLQAERLEKLFSSQQYQQAGAEVVEMRQSIRAAYVDAREAIDGLRLGAEAAGEFLPSLREYAVEFQRQSGIRVQVECQPERVPTDPATGLQLLRITQEALTNVRKHAQASQVLVGVSLAGETLVLDITDNGRGFIESGQPETRPRSYGLTTMRERARSLGGSLSVATGSGQGTRVRIHIPLKPR